MVGHENEILTELDCKKHPLTTTPSQSTPTTTSTPLLTTQNSTVQKDLTTQPQNKDKLIDPQKNKK